MKIKLALSLLLLLLFPAVVAHEGGHAVIKMYDDKYEPKNLEIEVGTKVKFENVGEEPHWPASNIHPTHEIYSDFDPRDIVEPGKSWSFVFDKPGVWRYHDHVLPEITGKITVTGEAKGSSSSGSGVTGVFTAIHNFIGKIFLALNPQISAVITGQTVQEIKFELPSEEESEEDEFADEYDSSISEDSSKIFNDDAALYSYIKKFGPGEAIKQLHNLQLKFGDCHQTAHRAGRFAYQIYNDQAFTTCSAECHSGCYHGAMEAYFRDHGTADLQESLSLLCSSDLNPFFSHQCIHGIGHGLMAWSDYEIHDALEACNMLDKLQGSCYTGVFMENIVGSLAEGHTTKYLSDDPHHPCDVVDEKYKWHCYFYQTSRMRDLFESDFAKVAEACDEVDDDYKIPCFDSMGRDVSGVVGRANIELSIRECSHAPEGQLRAMCLRGAVQDTFWDPSGKDTALRFCKLMNETIAKNLCYVTIIDRAKNVLPSEEEQVAFCEEVESQYYERCKSKIADETK